MNKFINYFLVSSIFIIGCAFTNNKSFSKKTISECQQFLEKSSDKNNKKCIPFGQGHYCQELADQVKIGNFFTRIEGIWGDPNDPSGKIIYNLKINGEIIQYFRSPRTPMLSEFINRDYKFPYEKIAKIGSLKINSNLIFISQILTSDNDTGKIRPLKQEANKIKCKTNLPNQIEILIGNLILESRSPEIYEPVEIIIEYPSGKIYKESNQ